MCNLMEDISADHFCRIQKLQDLPFLNGFYTNLIPPYTTLNLGFFHSSAIYLFCLYTFCHVFQGPCGVPSPVHRGAAHLRCPPSPNHRCHVTNNPHGGDIAGCPPLSPTGCPPPRACRPTTTVGPPPPLKNRRRTTPASPRTNSWRHAAPRGTCCWPPPPSPGRQPRTPPFFHSTGC